MKSRALFTIFVILILLSLAGCNQPYQSAAPQATPTTILADPNSAVFPATSAVNMNSVEAIITQTAQAGGATASSNLGPTSSILITPNVTTTPTVPVLLNTTTTATVDFSTIFSTTTTPVSAIATSTTSSGVVVATSTPVPVTNRPSTYTLQKGEFPYCIARRFNVNPDELLNLNGLTDGGLFEAGLVLKIPTTGNPFPASRSLHAHPTTFTVTNADETIYGVACYFGDLEPSVIASANNLALSAVLTIGQKLTIP